jgi:hypothetical protein
MAAGPEPVADQLRRTAIALRDARTREGLAIATGDDRLAGHARYEAQQLAGRLDELELAQARRDHWTTLTARAQARADAALGQLEAWRA